jgi:hypothetical protein
MALLSIPSTRTILLSVAAYFAACGLSAIFMPVSWLWVSGLPTEISNELGLTFGVVGAYLLALACGSLIAAANPAGNGGLILTLMIANVFDFLVTLRAVMNHQLPKWHGIGFLIVTVILSTLLTLAWRAASKDAAQPKT